MVEWHHWLNGHEFEQGLGVGEGQGSLAFCSSWGHKESDLTEHNVRHPLIELFHLSNFLQMLNEDIMFDVEFFCNFSCSFKRISFSGLLNWSLSTSDNWPQHDSSLRLLPPLQNVLNHHCTVCSFAVPRTNALLMLLLLYDRFCTQIRKSPDFAFCLTSFP